MNKTSRTANKANKVEFSCICGQPATCEIKYPGILVDCACVECGLERFYAGGCTMTMGVSLDVQAE